MSIRELATFHKVHRRAVRAALASSTPPPRKPVVRSAPVLGPWMPLIMQWLIDDLEAPPKQRHKFPNVLESNHIPAQPAIGQEDEEALQIVCVSLHRVRRPLDIAQIRQIPLDRDNRDVTITEH